MIFNYGVRRTALKSNREKMKAFPHLSHITTQWVPLSTGIWNPDSPGLIYTASETITFPERCPRRRQRDKGTDNDRDKQTDRDRHGVEFNNTVIVTNDGWLVRLLDTSLSTVSYIIMHASLPPSLPLFVRLDWNIKAKRFHRGAHLFGI